MQFKIKHPSNPEIIFTYNCEDSLASSTTVRRLLENIEISVMELFKTRLDSKYEEGQFVRFWNLCSEKTGNSLNKDMVLSDADPDDNSFIITWGNES